MVKFEQCINNAVYSFYRNVSWHQIQYYEPVNEVEDHTELWSSPRFRVVSVSVSVTRNARLVCFIGRNAIRYSTTRDLLRSKVTRTGKIINNDESILHLQFLVAEPRETVPNPPIGPIDIHYGHDFEAQTNLFPFASRYLYQTIVIFISQCQVLKVAPRHDGEQKKFDDSCHYR